MSRPGATGDLQAVSALVDSLASEWGDNGRADFRNVWFALDFDLSGSAWSSV
ncbi:hypothetical protein [Nocardiopsis coralliicola]